MVAITIFYNIFDIVSHGFEGSILSLIIFPSLFVIVLQYLILSSYNPNDLFDGSLSTKDRRPTKRSHVLSIMIVGAVLSVIAGFLTSIYSDRQDAKIEKEAKLLAGNDYIFYDTLIMDIAEDYDVVDCRNLPESEKLDKESLLYEVSALERQNIQGYNIVLELVERDDKLGDLSYAEETVQINLVN